MYTPLAMRFMTYRYEVYDVDYEVYDVDYEVLIIYSYLYRYEVYDVGNEVLTIYSFGDNIDNMEKKKS